MGPEKNTIVETKSGKLQGVYEDDLYVFRGIPYAAPPVGELRWTAPQPVKPWAGVRPARDFGTIAPQDVMPLAIPGRGKNQEPQNEDCLFLNVWTPAADNGKRAVMVWVHGGGFTRGSGSSPTQPGETLPRRGGVVLVSLNYRLGPLGFMNLREITGGKIPATGNEALLDQVMALQWVHDNIAAFGGDPDNVTVFGESAGAMSVGALLAMPQAKGLFRKAILQSGASTVRPLDQSVKVAERYLSLLGLTGKDTEALRSLPTEALINAAIRLPTSGPIPGVQGANFEPVLDGAVLKEVPLDAIEKGSCKDITVMAGSNLEEGKLFALMGNPEITKLDEAGMMKRLERVLPAGHVAGLVEKYRRALAKRDLPVTPFEIMAAITGDRMFRMPNIRLCEYQEKLGKPSFGYVFTWKSVAPNYGACHALEVGFVFGNINNEFHGTGPASDNLCLCMQDAWTAFAKTGDPSIPGLPWPRYGTDRKMMVLGTDCHVETAPYEAERAAWEGIGNGMLA